MASRQWLSLIVFALCVRYCQGTILDMTYTYNNHTWYHYISQKGFTNVHRVRGISEWRGEHMWMALSDFETGEHVGTHIDAPIHFTETGWSVDEIPPDRFISPAIMVDIRYKASPQTPDVNVTLEDLQDWERQYGRISDRAVVFMCSGWGEYYGVNEAAYWGNEVRDFMDWHFPGFAVDAVQWLIEERDAIGLGVDTPSIDYGASHYSPTHVVACGHNLYALEHVKNACALPAKGATSYVFPIKTEGGTGGPTRVVAIWDEPRVAGHVCSGGNPTGLVQRERLALILVAVELLALQKINLLFDN